MPSLLLFTADNSQRTRIVKSLGDSWTVGGGEDLEALDECEPADAAVIAPDWPLEPTRAAVHWLRNGLGIQRILLLHDTIGETLADAPVQEDRVRQMLVGVPQPTPPTAILGGGRAEPGRKQVGTRSLSATEARLLAFLMANPDRAIARSELLEDVWGYRRGVMSRTVDTTVRRLRKKVEADHSDPEHIQTVQGVGYRFRPPQESRLGRTNLGGSAVAFFGRQKELATLQQLVDSGKRLVSIIGTGGMGKTSLARAYARGTTDAWPGGVWFCDLSEARDLLGICRAVGEAIGSDAAPDSVTAALAGRDRALIVLDNFEQVVEHARDTISAWLDASRDTIFLVTSREPLRVRGEQLLPLAPLATSGESGSTARELFLDRARRVRPDFTLSPQEEAALRDLLEQLDGIPLAIELSAARVGVMSLASMAGHLADHPSMLRAADRDVPDRHRTLEATLEWSWDLLEPWEQATLTQCAVFRGGFTLEAVEAVVDLSPWPDAPWVLDIVQELVDKSLLHAAPVAGQLRFGMYWPVRAFAEARLRDPFAVDTPDGRPACGEDAIEGAVARHARWFARMGGPRHVLVRHQPQQFAAAAAELSNLEAACERMIARANGELAGRCYMGMNTTLIWRGPMLLSRSIGLQLLELELPPTVEGYVRYHLGMAHRVLGQREQAVDEFRSVLELHEIHPQTAILRSAVMAGLMNIDRVQSVDLDDALALAEEAEDLIGKAVLYGDHAVDLMRDGQPSEARPFFDRAIATARQTEAPGELGAILVNAAECARRVGELETARTLLEEAFPLLHRGSHRRFEGIGMACLGLVNWNEGSLDAAVDAFDRAVTIHRQTGFWPNVALELGFLANVYLDQDEPDQALDALTQAEEVAARYPLVPLQVTLGGVRAAWLSTQGRHGEARAAAELAVEQAREQRMGLYTARVLGQLGWICIQAGDEAAARAALDELEVISARIGAGDRSLVGRFRGRLRESLGNS